ncbi:CRISPR-associated helicase/endonuclease Cas3 [Stappia stellulata]|uniref:CRISPR-associated helicase/endonuclease Cas3 n=1 Tax=Stappia stellulata TaxID=71235 RepID=UPI00040DFE4B|nr:CRISPR-associated helicase/endonuclease Cas3 [Stappia stellulata]
MYFAHSGNDPEGADWQILEDHLKAVATQAAAYAKPLGLDRVAFLAGLYHDLGKYCEAFQRRLEGEDVRVDHSTAGAVAVLQHAWERPLDRAAAELAAYCIAGHHASLPDRLNETAACLDRRLQSELPALDPVWKSELAPPSGGIAPDLFATFTDPKKTFFSLSVATRMIFSCLVDADFKDTETHYAALQQRMPDRTWPALQDLLPAFLQRFAACMDAKRDLSNDLNRLRSRTLDHVRGQADASPGLFTLTVPTGGGKTLASLGFALDHARVHGHTRIIYAIPFTSIIDQTADVFRDVLGDGHVLEHHSSIDEEKPSPGRTEDRQQREKLQLAMEDWAAPVVVTTNVQFFESLFASRPARARKLHNIAGSVIILDEAQTLPRSLLKPAMRMLEELAHSYGCTIVLCTATQPALDADKLEGGLPLRGRELAPDPQELSRKLRRAYIKRVGSMTNGDLIAALGQEHQGLVIVNSRKHARELFQEAEAAGLDGLVHLTTRQCAVHRRKILERMRDRLAASAPCRVIATSLIEAGVDIDFPKVWRAEAGLDQIVQAAGRCNREGGQSAEQSIVTVFAAPDYPPPREIASLVTDMQRMLGRHDDLMSLAAIEDYFTEVYWRMGDKLDAHGILKMFTGTRRGTDFAFRTAAERFRMIESGQVPVIVAHDETAAEAIRQLHVPEISSGALARKLQGYTVQVLPKDREALIRNGHVAFERPDLRGDQFAVLKNNDLYRERVGLVWEEADYLSSQSSVI